MSDHTCPNCGQTILATDTVCWHCGWQLPRKSSRANPVLTQPAEVESEPYSLRNIMVYGGMTGLVIVLALWVMGSLGKRPLAVIADRTSLPAGWTAVTDANLTFTLNLPPGWSWQEAAEAGQDAFSQAIIQDDLLPAALAPFGRFDQQLQLLMLAANQTADQVDDLTGYLIIARDRRAQPLTLDDAKFLLEAYDDKIELLRTEYVDGVRGEPQADFLVRVIDDEGGTTLRCQQKIILQPQGNYLLAACSLPKTYTSLSTDLHDILASFQPLS